VTPAAVIEARHLCRTFRVPERRAGAAWSFRQALARHWRVVRAVDDLTLTVAPGEIVGYLGPNGAGKSTTVKMMTGILVPTSGALQVAGLVPWHDRVRYTRKIGVVFGQRTNLWWDLPLGDSLELLRHVYDVPSPRFRDNMRRFERVLGLGEFLATPVRQLSLGQRMRGDLAAALLHDPEIVFLDEPTIGLDVLAKQRIREFVRQANRERGITVVLTTHDLGDVERLCSRVALIAAGRLLFDGALSELVARFGAERELVVDMAEDYADVSVPGATVAAREGRRVTYRFGREEQASGGVIQALARQFRIADLAVRESDIERTVRRIYESMESMGPVEPVGPNEPVAGVEAPEPEEAAGWPDSAPPAPEGHWSA
jgi:ABC-2 type transport system ATP-binding protein